MKGADVERLLIGKFGTGGTREGNALCFTALVKATKQLNRIAVVLGEEDTVTCVCVYPWNPDMIIPGTEKSFTELLERLY